MSQVDESGLQHRWIPLLNPPTNARIEKAQARQNKNPTTREFFARIFDLCTVRLDGR
jgi:hypothetical protein